MTAHVVVTPRASQTVYTDHSLVDLHEWHSYLLNSMLAITLLHVNAAISVSNAR